MIASTYTSLAVVCVLLASICNADLQQKRVDRGLKQHPFTPIDRSYIKTPDGRRQDRQEERVDIVTTISSDGKTRQLATGSVRCRMWQNCILFEDKVSSHQWECSFDDLGLDQEYKGYPNKLIVGPDNLNLNDFLEINGAASGKTMLVLSEAQLTEAQIIIEPMKVVALEEYNESDLVNGEKFVVEDIGVRGQGKPLKGLPPRRLTATSGALNTLVVRVSAIDESPPAATALSEDIFGDEYCLKSQYERCSYGKLTIQEYIPGSVSDVPTAPSSPGVVEISVPVNANGNTKEKIQAEANTALQAKLGVSDPGTLFDLVLFCMPPGMGSWLAYAYIGRWDSYYNNDWCQSMSSQMHEVGHSLGLHHSGEYDGSDSNQEYGDQSDMMGFSYRTDDTPIMCFNPAKSWQLGWYEDKTLELNPQNDLSTEPTSYILNGVVDYEDNSLGRQVVLKINDFYIGFNKATDFNIGVEEGANQVTIVEKLGGPTTSTKSKLAAKLGIEGEHIIKLSDLISVRVKYASNDNGKDAVIELNMIGEPAVCLGEYDAEVTIEFTSDNYPSENAIGVADSTGHFVYFKDDYSVIGTTTTTAQFLCTGIEYIFIIQDSYGDGICCEWGNGSYTVKYKGQVLFTGNELDSEKIVRFTLPLETSLPTSSPTMRPTGVPSTSPTSAPTTSPSTSPTAGPTKGPTDVPSTSPTAGPTKGPTGVPSTSPTAGPTTGPIGVPSTSPTTGPTSGPSKTPTVSPTDAANRDISPPPTIVNLTGCVDIQNFSYRNKSKKDCGWVGRGTRRQIRIKCLRRAALDKSIKTKVYAFCKQTCDSVDIKKACSNPQ